MSKKITESDIKDAQKFVVDAVDFPEGQEGGLLVDHVDFWKFQNKLATVIIAKQLIDKYGVQIRKVDGDVMITLLEEAGRKENPKILKMFASLLFGHLNPATATHLHGSYSRVLGHLSKEDVMILEAMFAGINSAGFDYKTKGFQDSVVSEMFGFSIDAVIISFENIRRLGICNNGLDPGFVSSVNQIVFTNYGWHFMTACKLII